MDNRTKQTSKNFNLREEAELLLTRNEQKLRKSLPESENLQLIHELEVHQIELELQNEELKLAKEKAETAEKKYTELYDFAPSGYLTLTREGVITELNKYAEGMLGKKKTSLLNSSFGFFISPDTRKYYNFFLQDVFENKRKETCELKLETENDSVKYVYVSGIISNIEEKCLVTLVDITQRKHIENELIKAKEKAEENERLESAFLANMSHEIRTPMNGILGFTELLKNPNLQNEEQQNYIGIIEKSGVRMLNIINDIISISKIESHQIEVSVSDTNVNEQVEYIYSFFKQEAEQHKLHLSFKNGLPANKAFIKTDREKLFAVLTNLVKNAIKFTQTGSIEFGYKVKGHFLEFFVKDSGPGIPEEQKEIIFERFRQGGDSPQHKHEGSGLGLSISKAYVEMLGGNIWVENNTGKNGNASGATFYFKIPNHQVMEGNTEIELSLPDKSAKILTRKLNILIADDDEFSEMLFCILVDGITRNIFKARNGTEAVKTCLENPDIDLVLMDLNMPHMNGYEATRKIREFNKDAIIIAQTGYAFPGDREKSIAAGCNDSITKPINGTELIKLITNFFGSNNECVNDVIHLQNHATE